jgi:hypothetical protein
MKGNVCACSRRLVDVRGSELALIFRGVHTPSRRTHSAVSPSFRGRAVSEISPWPSYTVAAVNLDSTSQSTAALTRLSRVVVPSVNDVGDLVRLTYHTMSVRRQNVALALGSPTNPRLLRARDHDLDVPTCAQNAFITSFSSRATLQSPYPSPGSDVCTGRRCTARRVLAGHHRSG